MFIAGTCSISGEENRSKYKLITSSILLALNGEGIFICVRLVPVKEEKRVQVVTSPSTSCTEGGKFALTGTKAAKKTQSNRLAFYMDASMGICLKVET